MGIDLDEISLIATFPCDPDLDFFCSRRFSEKKQLQQVELETGNRTNSRNGATRKKKQLQPLAW